MKSSLKTKASRHSNGSEIRIREVASQVKQPASHSRVPNWSTSTIALVGFIVALQHWNTRTQLHSTIPDSLEHFHICTRVAHIDFKRLVLGSGGGVSTYHPPFFTIKDWFGLAELDVLEHGDGFF